eukprot:1954489-Prymnesium_polylepis.1
MRMQLHHGGKAGGVGGSGADCRRAAIGPKQPDGRDCPAPAGDHKCPVLKFSRRCEVNMKRFCATMLMWRTHYYAVGAAALIDQIDRALTGRPGQPMRVA